MSKLPAGTVTFLFSDIEGSTQLLERHGPPMGTALARHHEIFEQVVESHQGAIFETVGDAVYAAFAQPQQAMHAALEVHRSLAGENWGPIDRLSVRIAVHTGAVEVRGAHYFGPALFRCARLQAIGFGEQTLVSGATAALTMDDLPAMASLRDLGWHRLKDLGEPEHVFQLLHPALRTDFPPPKSLDARPHNLPVQLSSFVGREGEVASLCQLLADHRLVSVVGPGGIGKTRLALQVAADQVAAFADGTWFIDLAAVRDPALVPAAMASTLGLREQPGQPIELTLSEHLRAQQTLLVLDNVEQLLPAAAVGISRLMAASPDLKILVTSRAALRVRGEREYVVPPLPAETPATRDGELPPAVALFIERARAVRPDLTLTPESLRLAGAVCERLDGLPLAIELAAARLRLLALNDLHARLTHRLPLLVGGPHDLPERQQTLRSAVAWSEELLSERQRRLFARLSSFAGGFVLQSAEFVADSEGACDVLDGLDQLVEHSLVRLVAVADEESRYAMLETIREYAAEQLDASGEGDAVHERHAIHFTELLTNLAPKLEMAEQVNVLRRLRAERANLRAALHHWFGSHPDEYLRTVHLLMVPWLYFDGRIGECEAVVLRAEAAAQAASNATMARWYLDLGHVQFAQGDARQADASLRKGLEAGDPLELGRDYLIILRLLAAVAREREDFIEAERYIQEAVFRAGRSGEVLEEAHARLTSALIALRMGRYDAAGDECRLAIAAFDRHGDLSNVGSARLTYGQILESSRDLVAARDEYQVALRLFEQLGDDLGTTEARMALGYLAFLSGDRSTSVREILAAVEAMHAAGQRLGVTRGLATLAVVLGEQGYSALAARLVGWCGAEMERLGIRWTAEVHAGTTPELSGILRLQRDPGWARERDQGRDSTISELIREAREATDTALSAPSSR